MANETGWDAASLARIEEAAQAEREAEADALARNPYLRGVTALAEAGRMRPGARTVLCRAVMLDDFETADGQSIVLAGENSRRAYCYEVKAVGPDCPEWLTVGLHCLHLSAATSPLSEDKSNRWFVVDHEDIVLWWTPDDAREVARDLALR